MTFLFPEVYFKLTIAPTFTGSGPRGTPTLIRALIIPPPSALLWPDFFFFLLLLRFLALLLFSTGFCILGLLCFSKNQYTYSFILRCQLLGKSYYISLYQLCKSKDDSFKNASQTNLSFVKQQYAT